MNYKLNSNNIANASIAVVLLSYKHSKYIRDALDGIRLQTRVPDEVVIADDGSSDDTAALIKAYVQEYNLEGRWTLLLSNSNRGINESLQHAIEHTTSDIIIPMAGDDISLTNRCEVAESGFKDNPTINILTTDGIVIDENSKQLRNLHRTPGIVQDIKLAIIRGNPLVSAVGQCWRRRLFDQFGPLPTDVPNEDDQISFWGLLSGGIACLPVQTFKYRIHSASASAWLHNRQTSDQYFSRFVQDMEVRNRHLCYWQKCLQKSDVVDSARLVDMARNKANFYSWLSLVADSKFIPRCIYALSNRSFLSPKDIFYVIFGRIGVILWWRMRLLTGHI